MGMLPVEEQLRGLKRMSPKLSPRMNWWIS
jgi:hypothetical protein